MASLKWASAESSHLSHSSCCFSWRTLKSPLHIYSSVIRKGFRCSLYKIWGSSLGHSSFMCSHSLLFSTSEIPVCVLPWECPHVKNQCSFPLRGSAPPNFCLLWLLSSSSNILLGIYNIYVHASQSYVSHSTVTGISVCEKVLIMAT